MADQYTKTQLAKIVAPNLNDPSNYAGDLQKAFLAINENFKKIATMPFVQGVQGDSYKLDIRHIFENDVLTKDGATLFNSIFDKDLFKENMLLSTCISICKRLNLGLNGVTPLDGFLNGNEINELYFYSIYNDEGVATNSYLGQLYYFVDSRLLELGNTFASNPNSLIKFVDYSGFYRYVPISETAGKYVKTEILPTIYYDPERNDICWKLNGKETGISAVGAKGIDGTDASLTFVLVEPQDYNPQDPDFSGGVSAVTGVFKYGEYNEPGPDDWSKTEEDIKAIDNGVALICIKPQGSTVEYFAFGVIRTDGNSGKNAYWNSDTILDSFLEDEKINNYFSRIGYESNASSASCLSIPAFLYHSISENAYDIRHTISTTGDPEDKEKPGDLLFRMIYKDTSGNYKRYGVDEQVDGQSIKNFRIDNYNLVVQRIGTGDEITSDYPRFDLTDGFTRIAPAEIYLSKYNNDPDDPEGSNFTKLSCEEDSRFGAGLRVNGQLTAESTAEVKSTFTVGGQTKLNGGQIVNGNQTVYGSSTINGSQTVNGDMSLDGGLTFKNKGSIIFEEKTGTNKHLDIRTDGLYLSKGEYGKGSTIGNTGLFVDGSITTINGGNLKVSGKAIITGKMSGNNGVLTVEDRIRCENGMYAIPFSAYFNNDYCSTLTVSGYNTDTAEPRTCYYPNERYGVLVDENSNNQHYIAFPASKYKWGDLITIICYTDASGKRRAFLTGTDKDDFKYVSGEGIAVVRLASGTFTLRGIEFRKIDFIKKA